MDKNGLLQKFRELDFDKSLIGLMYRGKDNNEPYWCTPIGAEIIGWLGVDGVHFCFIPSLHADEALENGKVYVISPMPSGEQNVMPVANNFKDFLSLIVTCGDASPIEQISWMSEARFDELLHSERDCCIEGKNKVINLIQHYFQMQACPNPYHYVRAIQEDFDYSSIPFSDEYFKITGKERL